MSRTKKLIYNTTASVSCQLLSIISGLIIPRMILLFYSSTVNGLINSIVQFLSIISVLESGVSSVVQSNLYEPLLAKNTKQISEIFTASQKFFRNIAYIFLLYIFLLSIFYPFITSEQFSSKYTITLILILSIEMFAQYYFGLSYRIILNADQYSFVALSFQIITITLNVFLSVLLIKRKAAIQLVKLISAAIFLIQPISMKIFVDKKYKINHKLKLSGEPIKQKWNGLAQHIAFIVATRTDTVVLTLFSSFENVSIYSVYNLVLTGITSLISSLNLGIESFIGNMLAKNEKEKILYFFDIYEWSTHFILTFLFTLTYLLIIPFITVYTKDIQDVNYIVPAFAALITCATAIRTLRIPYNTIVFAAGHFKNTQISSIIEAFINIGISIIMVTRYGLVGVAIGTLISMIYRIIYLILYLKKNILYRNISKFITFFLVDILCIIIIIFSISPITYNVKSYSQWILMACKIGIIAGFEMIFIHILFFNQKLIFIIRKIRSR